MNTLNPGKQTLSSSVVFFASKHNGRIRDMERTNWIYFSHSEPHLSLITSYFYFQTRTNKPEIIITASDQDSFDTSSLSKHSGRFAWWVFLIWASILNSNTVAFGIWLVWMLSFCRTQQASFHFISNFAAPVFSVLTWTDSHSPLFPWTAASSSSGSISRFMALLNRALHLIDSRAAGLRCCQCSIDFMFFFPLHKEGQSQLSLLQVHITTMNAWTNSDLSHLFVSAL